SFDLERLGVQLRRFFDSPELRMQGKLGWETDLERSAEKTAAITGLTTLEGFRSGSATDAGADVLPALKVRFDCQLADDYLRPREVRMVRIAAAGDLAGDTATVALTAPVDLTDANRVWNWDVHLAGDLSRWLARFKPVRQLAGSELAGALNS